MDKEEYYKRIEKINNRFRTDRVSADEEYQLVCQRNYLSTKYIEHLEQQVKKQKEVIDKAIKYIRNHQLVFKDATLEEIEEWFNQFYINVLDILNNEIIDKINNLKIHYEIKPSFTTRKLKNLEQQVKKQKEVIDKGAEYIEKHIKYECDDAYSGMQFYSYHLYDFNKQELLDILKEVSK